MEKRERERERERKREKINCAQIKTSLVGIGGRLGVERRRQTKRGRGGERDREIAFGT